MGRGHNGTGTQWDGDTMGRGHNDTYPYTYSLVVLFIRPVTTHRAWWYCSLELSLHIGPGGIVH